MSACIFCQILSGELPASVVHEDDQALVFMDIHPLGRGHVLIVPRQHAAQITTLTPALGEHLFRLARQVLEAQRTLGWGLEGAHVLLNDGHRAQQKVPHVHVHVIPREKRDALPSLGRLVLHVTGLFGPAQNRERLNEQARLLAQAMAGLTAPAAQQTVPHD
ncbi:MAG: HIT family protein [Oleiphilaceae bacterium]|nr:HIT family protein [Oleiphilaceae bacterium]